MDPITVLTDVDLLAVEIGLDSSCTRPVTAVVHVRDRETGRQYALPAPEQPDE